MRYVHEDLELRMEKGEGILSKGNTLLFKGFPYTAIKMMLNASKHDPKVYAMFRQQLEQREKPRFQDTDKKNV